MSERSVFSSIANFVLIGTFVSMIATGAWVAKDVYTEMNRLTASISEVDGKLSAMREEVSKFEALKVDLSGLEGRLQAQDRAIGAVEARAETAVSLETSKLQQRLGDIETALANTPSESLPSGATIQNVQCLPLNVRVTVEGGKSYDFCESTWTLQVADVQSAGIVFGHSFYNAPTTITSFEDRKCKLQVLEILNGDTKNPLAAVRGICET